MILQVVCHNSRKSIAISSLFLELQHFKDLRKDVREEVSVALKKIKSNTNSKLVEESQNDQYKKYSVFDDQQDGSKQKSVAFMVHDLAF